MEYNLDLIETSIDATPPFCDCYFPRKMQVLINKNVHALCDCKCVENGYLNGTREWVWHKNSTQPEVCINNESNIIFHPVYSQGTAFVRGKKKLKFGMVHYWEIQVITTSSGTHEMVGIGTDKVNFNEHRNRFVGGLGLDKQSWGLSYQSTKVHNGVATSYGKRITQGCVIGVYLNLFHGYLEFFLNRKSLGIAFKNIPLDPSINLYPMISSTSFRYAIKLLNSTSHAMCLEFEALRVIMKRPELLNEVTKFPGLKLLLNKYWFLTSSTKYSYRSRKNELPLGDEVVLSKQAKNIKNNQEVTDIYENICDAAVINM